MEISLLFAPGSLCFSPAGSPSLVSPSQPTVKCLFPLNFIRTFIIRDLVHPSCQIPGAGMLPALIPPWTSCGTSFGSGFILHSARTVGSQLLSPAAPPWCSQVCAHSGLLIPSFFPQIWEICNAALSRSSGCTSRGWAAVDPQFSSIPGPFCAILLQVQDLLLSLPEPSGLRS